MIENMNKQKTVWEFFNLSQSDYSKLSWDRKKEMLFLAHGILPQERDIEILKKEQISHLPPELKNHPYGLLLQQYREHYAEMETIKRNYPYLKLNCCERNGF